VAATSAADAPFSRIGTWRLYSPALNKSSCRSRCRTRSHSAIRLGLEPLDRIFMPTWSVWGEIHMIKDLRRPTEAEEYQNTAEILRDLAAQMRFDNTRNALVSLDRLGAHAED